MKKNYLFGLLSLFTLLFAASCQEEDMAGGQIGDTATVTFQVNTPMLATRAVGDGTAVGKSGKLYVAVYEKDGQGWSDALGASKITPENAFPFEYVEGVATATVPLDLAKNKDYSVVFWAETNDNGDAYTIDWNAGGTLSLNTTNLKANQESYDAFWAQTPVNLTGAMTKTIELKRPFAQLNIGTSDKEAAANAGIVVEQTAVTVNQIPTVLNLQDSKVDADSYADVIYALAEIADIEGEVFPADKANQKYLSLNYLLVDEKITVDVDFTYKDKEDDAPYTLNFPSVPVQRNFRTNIYGTLLTNSANYTVEIKPGFGNGSEEDAANIVYASTADEVLKALSANEESIRIVLLNDITLPGYTTAYTTTAKEVVIESNQSASTRSESGKKFTLTFKDSYRTYFGLANKDAKVTFNNVNIHRETTGGTHWHDNNMKFTCNAEFKNVDFNKGICFDNAKTFVMNNCSINKGKVATYALFITAGCNVTIDGLSVTHSEGVAGRGIKIVDEDVKNPTLTTLSVSNATFVTESKAAIMVGSEAGAKITLSNLDLTGVKADQFNAVWVDEDYKAHADKVTVSGGFYAVEGDKAATDAANPFLVEGNTVKVAKGVYSALPKVANGVTIEAEKGTVFTGVSQVSGENVTIKNVTFSNTTTKGQNGEIYALSQSLRGTTFENCHFDAKHGARYCYAYGDVVFNDCTFGDENCVRGVHFDAGDGTVTFNRCTIYGFTALGGSVKKMTFNDCEFPYNNRYNVVNMYNVYEFNNCKFNPSMHTDCAGNGVVATFNDCSYTDGNSIYSLVRFDYDPATCTITFDGKQMVYNTAHLANAVKNMATSEATLLLAEGTFALPTSFGGKTLNLNGLSKESTILEMTKTGSSLPQYGGTKLSCNNMTVKRALGDYQGFQGQEEHYDNCIISGRLMTYSPLVTANECTFLPGASDDYNVQIYEAGTATFTNCKFNAYKGRSVYAYAESAKEMNITFTGCDFTSVNGKNENNFAPAIRLHTELGINGKLTINNCTNDDNFNTAINGGLWVEWNNSTKKLTNNFVKTINGASFVNADVYTAAQLKAAIADAQAGDVITLADGTYEGEFDLTGKNLTIKPVSESFEPVIKGLVWADNCTVTLEGLKLTNPNGVQHPNPQNSQYYKTINNQYPLVGAYNNAEIKFKDCTFDIVAPTVYGFYGYAHNSPVFEDCTFNCNKIRPIASNGPALTVTGCTFNDQYHYSARIFENSEELQKVVFTNNTIQGTNDKGEFEGINISKKGTTAIVLGEFTINGNTEVKYRHHKNVTMSTNCTYNTDIANFAFEKED